MSTEIETWANDRKVTVAEYGGDLGIVIESTVDTRKIPAFLTRKGAYELVDFITANIERPHEPTLFEKQWPEVKIGDEFGFGDSGSSFPYVKISDTEYASHSRGYKAAIENLTPGDHGRGITWRTPPKPSDADLIRELPIGGMFRFKDIPDKTQVKVSDTHILFTFTDGHQIRVRIGGYGDLFTGIEVINE